MPTKTDRILSYLPGTFRALPRPTALYSLADTFGSQLLLAENSLVAVMRAHWVDQADLGEEIIDDLAKIASLYGLAPRPEEDVEGFREHLKHYVRTFLEGTVTVQGILRIVAEVLGLQIADDYSELDTWWTRADDSLTDPEPPRDDATTMLFGAATVSAKGSPSFPARIAGTPDLSGGVDLRGASALRLAVDGGAPVSVDLLPHAKNPAAVALDEMRDALNAAFPAPVASHDGQHLVLSSSSLGSSSRLEIQDVAGDAAPRLLALLPRIYFGVAASSAQVTGTRDLGGGADLSVTRYLRVQVDGKQTAEVDCAGANASATTLQEIVAAINAALGAAIASQDGHFLTLSSTTTGFSSTIAVQPAAAQDAALALFGTPSPILALGKDPEPAKVVSAANLSQGTDLSARSWIEVQFDSAAPLKINCAGADPSKTTLTEIASAINRAARGPAATQDGRFVTLTSATTGPASQIIFLTPEEGDAAEDIFGIRLRSFQGGAATAARIVGGPDLSAGADLGALHLLRTAVDGGPFTTIELRPGGTFARIVGLNDLVKVINATLGDAVASRDGHHLLLKSPTVGEASRLEVGPPSTLRRRRFVTRAFVIDEAAQIVLGLPQALAQGTAAESARIVGGADLSRGVDLRGQSSLRVSLDGAAPVDVDCTAGALRPRAALLDEIVAAINTQLQQQIASHDGLHLVLTSPTQGSGSRISFESPRSQDALDVLMGLVPQTFRGRDASRVTVQGTVDLGAGADLSANDRVKIGVDGAASVEVACSGADPAHTSLPEIATKLNLALKQTVAFPQGNQITLVSPSVGPTSRIAFEVPAGPDATQAIFGFRPPRAYQGSDALKATATGTRDLQNPVDLSRTQFLRIAVDGQPPADVDCTATATDPKNVKLEDIVAAINADAAPGVASAVGRHLQLTSLASGVNARLDLLPYASGDARQVLFGSNPSAVVGSDPLPAVITGQADLSAVVDLSDRHLLGLAVDGGDLVQVDVSGAVPDKTSLAEIVSKVNSVFPGLASATPDNHLQLTSLSAGENSSLEIRALRTLDLIEYPPSPVSDPPDSAPPRPVHHGDTWSVENSGAAEAYFEFEIVSPQGTAGAELLNRKTGLRICLLSVIRAGERVHVWRDDACRLRVEITRADGTVSSAPASQVLTGPLGAQAQVPFTGAWSLSRGGPDGAFTLQLNNPNAPQLVVLRAAPGGGDAGRTTVNVTEAALNAPGSLPPADGSQARLVGRVLADASGYVLVDASKSTLARLRMSQTSVLAALADHVVVAAGLFYRGEGGPPILHAQRLAALFDVALQGVAADATPIHENYYGVTIGEGGDSPESFAGQITAKPSLLVVALQQDKAEILRLPEGRSDWMYLECVGARFESAKFDDACFAGGSCREIAIFDVSSFGTSPQDKTGPLYAPPPPLTGPGVEVRFRWPNYQPGAFEVNLPADLPEEFGARFGQSRFSRKGEAPEIFPGAVTEPASDSHFLVNLINAGLRGENIAASELVAAAVFPNPVPPPGWVAMTMPFHHPQARKLSGGTPTSAARMYLTEPDSAIVIRLSAKQNGAWGNTIAVTARRSGPAQFDVTVAYEAARFENARMTAFAGRILGLGETAMPEVTGQLLQPSPVGVLQARAAGVRAEVTRDSVSKEPNN